jgi:hypothetical protein
MGETAAVGGDGDSREVVGECPPRRRSGVGCASYISLQQRDAGNTSSYRCPPRRRSRWQGWSTIPSMGAISTQRRPSFHRVLACLVRMAEQDDLHRPHINDYKR